MPRVFSDCLTLHQQQHFNQGCTDKALADYRSADNRCQTIGRLSADYRLIQKVPETGQKPAVHTV